MQSATDLVKSLRDRLKGAPLPLYRYGMVEAAAPEDPATTHKYGELDIVKLCQTNAAQEVAMFIAAGYDPNNNIKEENGATALHIAAGSDATDVMSILIQNGANIDQRLPNGKTPLMCACENQKTKAVAMLLLRGAKGSVSDDAGRTAAYYSRKNPMLLAMLHSYDATLDGVTEDGKTLLHELAAFERDRTSLSFVTWALKKVDVDHQDGDGDTALHIAARSLNLEGAKVLLARGASTTVRNHKGQTATTQPFVDTRIKKLVDAYNKTTSATMKDKLLASDGSNVSNLDVINILHFVAWGLLPNLLLYFLSSLPPIFVIMSCFAFFGVFAGVASFSMGTGRRSFATAGFYTGLLTTGCLILQFQTFGRFESVAPDSMVPTVWRTVTLMMYISYISAVLRDPGCVPLASSYDELCKKIRDGEVVEREYCRSCLVKKPLRSKHCKITGRCVLRFDHYCVWTANAIGGGNHRFFVLYLYCQVLSQTLVTHTAVMTYIVDAASKSDGPNSACGWATHLTRPEVLLEVSYLLIYDVFAYIFALAMVVGQTWYTLRNVTSNETWYPDRYSWSFAIGSRAHTVFDKGACKNFVDFWTGNLTAILYTVPPMSDYVQKLMAAQAEKERKKAEKQQNTMKSFAEYQSKQSEDMAKQALAPPGTSAAPPISTTQSPTVPSTDRGAALQDLSKENRDNVTLVQNIVAQLDAGEENPEFPEDLSVDERLRVLQQARTMYSMVKLMRQQQQQQQ